MTKTKRGRTRQKHGRLPWYLAAGIALLLIAHLVVTYAALYWPDSALARATGVFDMDNEYNVPTYANSLLFVVSAFWCARLAGKAKWLGHRAGWLLFGLVCLYFALDEALIIHEQLAEPLRKLWDIQAGSPFFHAWIIPGGAGVLLLGVAIAALTRYHKRLAIFTSVLLHLFLLAVGVIVLEVIGTYVYKYASAYRLIVVPLEETFELGMSALLWLRLRKRYLKSTPRT